MERTVRMIVLGIAMSIGSYVPTFLGASVFGLWSILGMILGGAVGIWLIRAYDI